MVVYHTEQNKTEEYRRGNRKKVKSQKLRREAIKYYFLDIMRLMESWTQRSYCQLHKIKPASVIVRREDPLHALPFTQQLFVVERENRCFEEVASNRGGAWKTYCWPLSLIRVRGALIYRYLIQFPLNSKMVVDSTLGYMICPAPGLHHYNGDVYISFILCSKTSILTESVWLP